MQHLTLNITYFLIWYTDTPHLFIGIYYNSALNASNISLLLFQRATQDLRTKNWKVMEALQTAEKALQSKPALPAQETLRVSRITTYNRFLVHFIKQCNVVNGLNFFNTIMVIITSHNNVWLWKIIWDYISFILTTYELDKSKARAHIWSLMSFYW